MIVTLTVLDVPAPDAELAADRLTTAGAIAIEEREGDAGRIELRAALGEDSTAIARRLSDLPRAWSVTTERADATAIETWREFAGPTRVTPDLTLRPAWLAPTGEEGVTELAIEPGAAFGLGDHPTTRLSAAAVWRCTRPGDRVLDVGCGAGVLALVAATRGADVLATDIAVPAIAATLANAERNRLADRVQATPMPLREIDGRFDLVVANILAPTLIELADDLRRVTRRTLIISGVLADRHDHVLAALAPMQAVATDLLDGWAAVELSAMS